jgi:hypothetical protein
MAVLFVFIRPPLPETKAAWAHLAPKQALPAILLAAFKQK